MPVPVIHGGFDKINTQQGLDTGNDIRSHTREISGFRNEFNGWKFRIEIQGKFFRMGLEPGHFLICQTQTPGRGRFVIERARKSGDRNHVQDEKEISAGHPPAFPPVCCHRFPGYGIHDIASFFMKKICTPYI